MNRTERCINIGLSISLNIFEIISIDTKYFADPFKGIMKAQLFLFLCFRARIICDDTVYLLPICAQEEIAKYRDKGVVELLSLYPKSILSIIQLRLMFQ